MTLYYSLVFMLLVVEMVVFVSLIIPMPFTWRRRLFNFISENPLIAKIQYGMKITFIFILVLFIDSVNRVYRVQVELGVLRDQKAAAEVVGSARTEVQARKFYSERNMYLCGFTIFLSLILNRTYVTILDVLRLEEEVKMLKGDSSVKGSQAAKLGNAGNAGEIGALKKQLEKAQKDLETMRKQHDGFQREYNRLGDEKAGVSDGSILSGFKKDT